MLCPHTFITEESTPDAKLQNPFCMLMQRETENLSPITDEKMKRHDAAAVIQQKYHEYIHCQLQAKLLQHEKAARMLKDRLKNYNASIPLASTLKDHSQSK